MAEYCYDDDSKKKLLLNELNNLNNCIIQSLLSRDTRGIYRLATDKNNEVIKPGLIVISAGDKLTELPPLVGKKLKLLSLNESLMMRDINNKLKELSCLDKTLLTLPLLNEDHLKDERFNEDHFNEPFIEHTINK